MAQGLTPGRSRIRLVLLIALASVLLAVALVVGRGQSAAPDRTTGLFTTLPILWRETHDLGELLNSDAPPHWAQGALAAHGRLQPLDTLAGKSGKLPLPDRALLVMAQPRGLSPGENVALDDWVRAGGRVLLFADPMLTSESTFAIGDKRRPQDVALLSPILARWGLELQFDEDQPLGEDAVALLGGTIPVHLPGRFALRGRACRLLADGLAARCRIGKGVVVAVADAALFEVGTDGENAARSAMLDRLLRRITA